MKFKEKKEKRKFFSTKVWVSIFIIAVMVLSTAGFFLGPGSASRSLSYNGYSFKKEPDGYYTNINGRYVRFDFFPAEINDTIADNSAISVIKNTKMIYMTSNFTGKYAQGIEQIKYEFSNRLAKEFNIYAASGFTTNTSFNTLTINCENATQFIPVLDFREGNATKIYTGDNCIIIEGSSETDFVKLRDRLLYGLYGIME